jgi:hypothetical protein
MAFVPLLACSALGICWKELAPRAHDCCKSETPTPTKGCAALTVTVQPESVPAPAVMAAPPLPAPSLQVLIGPRFAPAFAAKAPPLVLRI